MQLEFAFERLLTVPYGCGKHGLRIRDFWAIAKQYKYVAAKLPGGAVGFPPGAYVHARTLIAVKKFRRKKQEGRVNFYARALVLKQRQQRRRHEEKNLCSE